MKHVLHAPVALMIMGFLLVGCQNPAMTSAKIYIKQGQWEQAVEQLKIVNREEPDNAEAYFKLGTVYAEMGNHEEMNQAFDKALEIDEKKYGEEVKRWRTDQWTQSFNAGVEALNVAKAMEERLLMELDNVELAQKVQNTYERAAGRFEVANTIYPQRSEAWSDLGFVYYKLKRSEESLRAYEKAAELNPTDPEAWRRVAVSYVNAGQQLKAAEIYEKLLTISPDDENALMMRAASYDQAGDREKAIEAYEKAIALLPEEKDLHYNLGILYFQESKDHQLAIDQFQKALEIDPDDPEANFNLGIALFAQDQWDQALPRFQKVVELEPTNAEAWEKLGVIYIRKGMRKEGEEAFKKAEEHR